MDQKTEVSFHWIELNWMKELVREREKEWVVLVVPYIRSKGNRRGEWVPHREWVVVWVGCRRRNCQRCLPTVWKRLWPVSSTTTTSPSPILHSLPPPMLMPPPLITFHSQLAVLSIIYYVMLLGNRKSKNLLCNARGLDLDRWSVTNTGHSRRVICRTAK